MAANGTVSVSKNEVTALRSDAEQAAFEKSLHPTLLQGWAGGANVGFALTRGNSQTKNLALAFTADRKRQHDEHYPRRGSIRLQSGQTGVNDQEPEGL
jgi:hypothetical protein